MPGAGAAIAPPFVLRRATRSIAWRIFALVVATFVAATAVLFAVTFSGPPPMPAPQTVANIAVALVHGGMPAGTRAAIEVETQASPPGPFGDERRLPAIEQGVASRLGVPPAAIIAFGDPMMDGPDEAGPGGPRFGGPDLSGPPFGRPSDQPAPSGRSQVEAEIRGRFQVGWRLPGNATARWRVARTPMPPFLTRWHKATLLAMGIALLVLLLPAWWLARAISLPIERLAAAADGVRAGAPLGPLPAGGPGEIRTLNRAVTAMHDRLARHAEQRTDMLAAIAHDLGTPLSRLAFWVEQLPGTAHDRAVADIDEMRAMIADTLGFARDEAGERDSMRVELGSLLDSLVEDMRVGGGSVTLEAGPRAIVRGDPGGFRRLFANLVGNAIRYGDRATVRWSIAGGRVVVLVEDEGPGVDPAMAERLFEPFVRGDPSRSRATGGTGLGLAIVRAIAARHGGEVTLANRGGNGRPAGAVARVVLPLAG